VFQGILVPLLSSGSQHLASTKQNIKQFGDPYLTIILPFSDFCNPKVARDPDVEKLCSKVFNNRFSKHHLNHKHKLKGASDLRFQHLTIGRPQSRVKHKYKTIFYAVRFNSKVVNSILNLASSTKVTSKSLKHYIVKLFKLKNLPNNFDTFD
jgi:hypothetical protein